jgi:hypothetical protein
LSFLFSIMRQMGEIMRKSEGGKSEELKGGWSSVVWKQDPISLEGTDGAACLPARGAKKGIPSAAIGFSVAPG